LPTQTNGPYRLWRLVRDETRARLAHQGAGHGFDHTERVLHNARLIQAEAGGDRLIVELAALLHDVGDAKFHQGRERSGEFARDILNAGEADQRCIEAVVHIVENLSFRKTATAQPLSLEGQIVQDADRLDALGAVGIVRTIEYGASIGQPFHVAGDREARSGVAHFDEKLFRLRERMNTAAGKRMAAEREAFMRRFLEQFFAECEPSEAAAVACDFARDS
jgi:uncharacterized protein